MSADFPLSAYLKNLGFVRNPFPVTPDEHGIFFSSRLAEQFTELLHCIEQRKGFMLVTGDVGVGKSTLSRALLSRLAEQGACTALIFNTFLQGPDLLRAINRDFGITAEGDSLEALLQALNTWLLHQRDQGRNCVLILDDAQGLEVSSLELIRQLSNLEASQAKLLQIVMVAQPEIRHTLDRHDMRQLASRIALRLELLPLSLSELDVYLHHRLQWAGCPAALTLDRRALRQLHRYSLGYIRRVHILLDRCLYGLAINGSGRINASLVDTAARELSLARPTRRPGYGLVLAGGLAGVGAIAAVVMFGMAPAVTLAVAVAEEPPALAVAAPQEPAPQPSVREETVPEADAAWQAFIAAHAPLPVADVSPTRWAEVFEWLPARSNVQPWVPVLLPQEWQRGCDERPLYPLSDGQLALFRAALPVVPQPFGEAGAMIVALQQVLVAQGFLTPEAVDGVMGPRTATALAQFQKQSGLLASGQPDADTAYLLACLGGGDA